MIPALWRFGPVTVANHIRDDNMGAIARRILAEAPPRFALAGHSMGGYIAFEIMRQAPERVAKLALINTQARPDTPEATERRRGLMARARRGRVSRRAATSCFPASCIRRGATMPRLRQLVHDMGDDVGVEGFVRQQTAMIGARGLAADARLDQVPDAGADRRSGQHHPEFAVEGDGRRHPGAKLVILPNCGHLPQPEQPEATAAALVEWLRS